MKKPRAKNQRCRVLFVDDEDEPHSDVKKALAGNTGVELVAVRSAEEALAVSASVFFHLALVDLQLDLDQKNVLEGKMVVRELAKLQPACTRLAMTAYADSSGEDIAELLSLPDPEADGVVSKWKMDPERVILDYVDSWHSVQLTCPWSKDIASAFASTWSKSGLEEGQERLQKLSERSAEVELHTLLGDLFGARHATGPSRSVTLRLGRRLTGGYSGSQLFVTQPQYAKSSGNYTVVKVGLRESIRQEVERYEQWVRFDINMSARVELLGSAIGSKLGVAAYSLAGSTGDSDEIVQTLADAESPVLDVSIEKLFSRKTQYWFNRTGPSVRLLPYYIDSNDGKDLTDILSQYSDLVHSVSTDYNRTRRNKDQGVWVHDTKRDSLQIRGATLDLAGRRLRDILIKDSPSCVVHGDMHARNVLVASEDSKIDVRLIDFARAGWGPRTADFVAMMISLKLEHAEGITDLNRLASLSKRDENDLATIFSDRRPSAILRSLERETSIEAATTRIGVHARSNFSGLGPQEFCSVGIVQALWLLSRIDDEKPILKLRKRIRVIAWISALWSGLEAATTAGQGAD